MTRNPLETPTTAAHYSLAGIEQRTRLSQDVLAAEAGALRAEVAALSSDVRSTHSDTLDLQLRSRTEAASKRAAIDLLNDLADRGFSWTAIARLVGVSIPAVRKWRLGEQVAPDNRKRLASLVAFVEVMESDHMVDDVASWMEIPLDDSDVNGIDLYVGGYVVELVEYGSEHVSATDVLDVAAPGWRERRSGYEVFTAGDGENSIRIREPLDP